MLCMVTWCSPGLGWTSAAPTTAPRGTCSARCTSSAVRGDIPDTCLLLEHRPVYTAGKRTSPLDRPIGDPGAPVIDVDRGGKITWHGPGQLVGYPIVALAEPVDVVAYVRLIEDALIRACAEFGLQAGRVEGRSGVWLPGDGHGKPDRKVAAIGIRVARGVTMHGFALNCDCDLSWFDRIVPCGMRDAALTSLSAETGRRITVADVLDAVERHLARVLGATSVHARRPRPRQFRSARPNPAGPIRRTEPRGPVSRAAPIGAPPSADSSSCRPTCAASAARHPPQHQRRQQPRELVRRREPPVVQLRQPAADVRARRHAGRRRRRRRPRPRRRPVLSAAAASRRQQRAGRPAPTAGLLARPRARSPVRRLGEFADPAWQRPGVAVVLAAPPGPRRAVPISAPATDDDARQAGVPGARLHESFRRHPAQPAAAAAAAR